MTLKATSRSKICKTKRAQTISVINTLLTLKQAEQISHTRTYTNLIARTVELHAEEAERVHQTYVMPFQQQYSFLQHGAPSFLELLGCSTRETYHSKILAYLWSLNNPYGRKAFGAFLSLAGIDDIDTTRGLYNIYTEHHTGYANRDDVLNNRRIDLLAVSHTERWVIIIENKVCSRVNTWEDGKQGMTQLKGYQKYCQSNRAFRNYQKYYILLSYNTQNKTCAEIGWHYVDYHQLFQSLFPYRDSIQVQQYLITLWSLLVESPNTPSRTSLTAYQTLFHSILSRFPLQR